MSTGPAGAAFEGRTFLDADAIAGTNVAIAVEQDRAQTGPPRLMRLDLLAQDDKELATLQDFAGGLSVSPSGKKVAYYVDKEVLEIRDLSSPHRVARVRAGLGVLHWAPDEQRVLLKRAVEKKTGELVWIDIPELSEVVGWQRDSGGAAYSAADFAGDWVSGFCDFGGWEVAGGYCGGETQFVCVSFVGAVTFLVFRARRNRLVLRVS